MTTAEIQSPVVAPAKNSKRIKYREMYVEDFRSDANNGNPPTKGDIITLSYSENVEKKPAFGTPSKHYAIFDEDGVPCNMNDAIKNTQGWCGTSYGWARYAVGNYRIASAVKCSYGEMPNHLADSQWDVYKVRLAPIDAE